MGHTAKECRKEDLKRKRARKEKEEPKSNLANYTTSELFLTEYCSTYAACAREEGWYVDSGASKHMPNKAWFKSSIAL